MKTILRIDASIRHVGSYSRMMGDHFISRWKHKHLHGAVLYRDIDAQPIPHLSKKVVDVFFGSGEDVDEARLSTELIDELKRVDEILIACPMYNFGIPSTLKAYFDHIVRVNQTFRMRENAHEGLLINKKAFILTARGGRTTGKRDSGVVEEYLETILSFIGITDIKMLTVEGTATNSVADDWQAKIDHWFD